MRNYEKVRRQREHVYENEERRSAAKLQEMLSEAKAREVLAEHGDRRDANTQQRIHRQKELEVTLTPGERKVMVAREDQEPAGDSAVNEETLHLQVSGKGL